MPMRGRVDAVVLCGPVPPSRWWLDRCPEDPLVIAADVGARHAATLGYRVDVLVGDLDSLEPHEVAAAQRAGARIERHAASKDATDLELALDVAAASRAREVVVVDGGVGPRVDHFLANALLLGHSRYERMSLRAALGASWVTVARPGAVPSEIRGTPGSFVSLLPVGGAARVVDTTGLRWRLTDEDLVAHATRGVSNEMLEPRATIQIERGVVLVVQPVEDVR